MHRNPAGHGRFLCAKADHPGVADMSSAAPLDATQAKPRSTFASYTGGGLRSEKVPRWCQYG